MTSTAWKIFNLGDLTKEAQSAGAAYHEFLHEPSMSCGIYHLKAGSKDMQGFHDEDEVYVVLEGKGKLGVGNEDQMVGPGAVLFVRASEDHAFFEIQEDMTMLVLFAAPRSGMR